MERAKLELVIDTATEEASIAVSRGGRVQADTGWHAGQNHTVDLIPAIVKLLQRAGAEPGDITAVIVSRGPGSYNGLRVGVGSAKGLAYALGIPLVGIGTLEAEAFPHAASGRPLCAVQDAGRGEVAAATFQMRGDEWHTLVPEHITTLEELCATIEARSVLCGRFAAEAIASMEALLGGRATVEGNAFCRARPLAELGWRRLQRGYVDDLKTLQPLYLRRPAITTPRKGKR